MLKTKNIIEVPVSECLNDLNFGHVVLFRILCLEFCSSNERKLCTFRISRPVVQTLIFTFFCNVVSG